MGLILIFVFGKFLLEIWKFFEKSFRAIYICMNMINLLISNLFSEQNDQQS